VIVPTEERFDLLPGHAALPQLPFYFSQRPDQGLHFLSEELETLPRPYDVILIDFHPTPSLLTAMGMYAATRCVAPVQSENMSFQALLDLDKSIKGLRKHNARLQGMAIVRNKYETRSEGKDYIDQQLRETFGSSLLETIIPKRDGPLHDSSIAAQTAFRYDHHASSEIRRLFQKLAIELYELDAKRVA
jgi:chromosome partitioning protein